MDNWIEYTRVSSDEQAKRGTSRPEQADHIRGKAAANRAHILHHIWDEVTGTNMFRPGIAQITELAIASGKLPPGHPQKVTAICADEITRLHRCQPEFEMWVQNVLTPNGIRIELVTGMYVAKAQDPDLWLASQFPSLYGDAYSAKLSKRLRSANEAKSNTGKLVSGRPFGSKRNPLAYDPNRPAGYIQRVRDEERYPDLLELFQRRADGDTLSAIARDFAKRGIPTVDGGKWSATTVRSIINCRWYIGEVTHKGKVICNAAGEPLYSEHNCMVPVELWQAAQRPQKRQEAASPYVFLLSGKVVSSNFRVTAPASHSGGPQAFLQRYRRGKPFYQRADWGNAFYSCEPADEGALLLPGELYAPDLEHLVLTRIFEAADNDELLTAPLTDEAAPNNREQRRDAAQAALASVESAIESTRIAIRQAARDRQPNVLAVLEEEMAALAGRAERLRIDIAATGRPAPRLLDFTPTESVNLLRECWRLGLRVELARLLGAMIDRVDVRHDGIRVYLVGKESEALTRVDADSNFGLYIAVYPRRRKPLLAA